MFRSFKSTALLVSAMSFACIAADAPAAKAAPAAPAAPVAASAPAAAPAASKTESTVKIEPATQAAAPGKVAATSSAGTSCEDVKASIDAKLKAKGVKTFTLDVVATADVKDAKVVGTCEAGAKKITYKRG